MSQRLGFLGARPIDEVVEHAGAFVHALESVSGRVVDLGSGGGVPGLVIAVARPDLRLTLVDRRTKRTDFLRRMVRRLQLDGRVTVISADIDELPHTGFVPHDAAVARGFGPPEVTLAAARRVVRADGVIVISEPPDDAVVARWDEELLAASDVIRLDHPDRRVAVFRATPL